MEKQVKLLQLFADFEIASLWASRQACRDSWCACILSGEGCRNAIYNSCQQLFFGRFTSKVDAVIQLVGNRGEFRDFVPPVQAAHAAWRYVLENMKDFHSAVIRTNVNRFVACESCEFMQAANFLLEIVFGVDTLPIVQAYYAVRLARDFDMDATDKLLPNAREILGRVPLDSDLYVEDAEMRQKRVATDISRFLSRRATALVSQFAVSIAINAFFLGEFSG